MGTRYRSNRTAALRRGIWAFISALALAMGLSLTAVPAAGATYTVSGTITVPAGLVGLWLDVSVMQDEFTAWASHRR